MMRLESFLSFHKRFVVEDDLVGPMKAYFRIASYTEEEIWKFLCLYATCYSIPTSILFMNCGDIRSFCQENKSRLIFQSDRRWMRIGDRFVRGFGSVHNPQLFKFLHNQKVVDIRTSIDRIRECAFFGRFSAYLLLEAFMGAFGKDGFFSGEFNFWEGDTATSGLLNVMGRDADADAFDAGVLRVLDADSMKKTLDTILSRLQGAGNCSIAFVETSLCAYRKLFKGSRYLGYYTDRCLQELNYTKKAFPGFSRQLSLFTDARLSTLPVKCLGELGGWDGVRKDRKKRFLSGKGF